MKNKNRPEFPKNKIIQVNNSKKIDFTKPYKIIRFDWLFEVVTFIPYFFLYFVALCSAVFFGFRIKGKENLKILRKQGCITISNHCHYFDTSLVCISIGPRRVSFSRVPRNFEVPKVRTILRIVRAFPIPSKNGVQMIHPFLKEVFRRKKHVHVLVEGNLMHLGQSIHRFKSGAFVLSCMHQVPIVPLVFVIKRRMFRGKPMRPNWVKITMVAGEPIYPPKLNKDNTVPHKKIEAIMDKTSTWMADTIAEYHQGK